MEWRGPRELQCMPEDEREGVWDIKRGDKRSEAGGVFGGEHVEGGKKKKALYLRYA